MEYQEPTQDILEISAAKRYQTVEELLTQSTPNQMFYTMLVLSTLIISGGVILGNTGIIIGGMLVTPLLTQILVLALGFTTGQTELIKRVSIFIGKITLAIIVGSFVLGLVFGRDVVYPLLSESIFTGILYMIVAIASGVAATVALIHKEMSEVLPGVAIAVSLVPPLAFIGVALSQGDGSIASDYIMVYILNLFGIILGSFGVFSLSQFGQSHRAVQQHEQETVT